MHLPAQRVMEVSLHRSEKQMRDDYCGKAGTDDSRAKTTRLMARYASGIKTKFDVATDSANTDRTI